MSADPDSELRAILKEDELEGRATLGDDSKPATNSDYPHSQILDSGDCIRDCVFCVITSIHEADFGPPVGLTRLRILTEPRERTCLHVHKLGGEVKRSCHQRVQRVLRPQGTVFRRIFGATLMITCMAGGIAVMSLRAQCLLAFLDLTEQDWCYYFYCPQARYRSMQCNRYPA